MDLYKGLFNELYAKRSDKYPCLMDIATIGAKKLKADGILNNLDESEEINACSIKIKAEIDGDMGDSHVGLQARLMSQGLRKLIGIISKTDCVVIFINQLREKIGVMFGNPETTTGGRALKFYASIRMDVRRTETLKQSGDMVGNRTRVKIVKNKIAPPFKEAEFDIMFGKGISKEGDILDLAVSCNLVSKSGAWFAYNGDKIGQGRENAKTYLREHPEVMEELETKIREHYNIGADTELGDKDVKPMQKDGKKGGAKKSQASKQEKQEKKEEAAEEAFTETAEDTPEEV